MSKRVEQAERTREAILEAALAAFAERGVGRASIRDVANRACIAPGLVYHYFPDKRALVRAVMEERSFLPELTRMLEAPVLGEPEEVFRRIGERFVGLLGARRDVVAVVFREALLDAEIAAMRDAMIGQGIGLLVGYLENEVKRGVLRPHDSRAIAKSYMMALIASHLIPHPPVEDLPRKLSAVLIRGLSVRI